MILDEKVAAHFRQIARDQETGLLVWEAGEVKRQLFFELGMMVSARSSLDKERLGQLLVRQGRITAEQLREATHFIPSGMRLGQILLELGHLKGGEIERYVLLHMLEVACGMLETAPDRLAFSDQVEVQADTLSPLSVADVIMEAVRRLPDLTAYRSLLLREGCGLRLAADRLLRSQRVSLSPEETFVLSRLQEGAPARALFTAGPLSEEQMVRILVGFVHAGLAELQLEPQAAGSPAARGQSSAEREIGRLFDAFQCQNHWQVLGVDRFAPPEELERAYRERTSQCRSEEFQRIVDLEFQEKLSFVLARIQEAYTVLATPARSEAAHYRALAEKEGEYEKKKTGSWDSPKEKGPETTPPRKDPQEAKRLFQRAKRAFAASEYWETIQLLRAAIDLGDNDPEHFHLLGKALAQNPKWRRDAEQNFSIAIKLSPWQAKYQVALAELYHREGLHGRARRVLGHVATIDPNYPLPRFEKEPPQQAESEAPEMVARPTGKRTKPA